LFHLTTHAFFKALLFLSAGSIIHALHHEQDIWRMGGLWRKLPVTFAVFTIGGLALCGIWPTSGFYSKESILLGMPAGPAQVMAIITACLTPFYVTRTWCLTFLGEPRVQHDHPPHEASWRMLAPLVLLAVAAIGSGWSFAAPSWIGLGEELHHEGTLALIMPWVPVAGIAVGFLVYGLKPRSSEPLASAPYTVLERRFFVDELYEVTVLKLQEGLAISLNAFERVMFQLLPISAAQGLTGFFNRLVGTIHTGNVSSYVVTFCVSMVLLIALLTQV
jgi:NADH-quinone oxidoreductase subunit L